MNVAATDPVRLAIAETDRECAEEIANWPERRPEDIYFSMSVRDWRVVRAAAALPSDTAVERVHRMMARFIKNWHLREVLEVMASQGADSAVGCLRRIDRITAALAALEEPQE